MSHLKERKATNCLNCNAEVNGKFCSVCGQENIEPAESAWHLITHFFNDITHFDGKFFSSLNYLIFKPGFLSAQYKMGRRANFLNPVRMYVFTSFIFFLVFFSIYHFDEIDLGESGRKFNKKTITDIRKMSNADLTEFAKDIDSTSIMSREDVIHYVDSVTKIPNSISEYSSTGQYDSLVRSGQKKHSWLMRKINHRQIELNKKFDGDSNKMMRSMIGNFMHRFPQMLFVSLPLFALFLKLIYRRSKEFYYVSHAIFSLHLYIFTFIILLVQIGLTQLAAYTKWDFIAYITGFLTISIFFYEYKAMRNFYGQSRAKTLVKFFLLNLYMLFLMIIIFTFFLIFSFLKV